MKIRYMGIASYQERPVTGLDGLWQPNQAGYAEGSRLSKLLATELFIDDEIEAGEGMVSFKTDPLTGWIQVYAGTTNLKLVPTPNYYCHLYAGKQLADDDFIYDLSGKNNNAIRGANLSRAQLWANAGYFSTIDPVGGSTNSVLRIPALNFDYMGGEKLILWWLGKITPEAGNASFMGDGITNSPGLRLRVQANGKYDLTLYGPSGVTLFGSASVSALFDGSLKSVGVVVDGSTRKYAYFSDGVLDAAFSQYALLSSGADCDTKNANTFNIGQCSPASSSSTDGVPVQTRAFVAIRIPPGMDCPSIADVQSLFAQLRRDPSGLVPSGVF